MDFFSKIYSLEVFQNMSLGEIKALNFCLKSRLLAFKKNEIIVPENTNLDYFYLLVSGSARTVKNTESGDEVIISEFKKGQVFGLEEVFANRLITKYDFVATTNCEILQLVRATSLKSCENNCPRHKAFINNLIKLLAKKNLELCERINLMTKKSTKEKVLSYLKSVAQKSENNYFDIPYNRQELADYLSVDRSALSYVLSTLKQQGILDYNKNHFMLK